MQVTIVTASHVTGSSGDTRSETSSKLFAHLSLPTDDYLVSERPKQAHALAGMLQHLNGTAVRTVDLAQQDPRTASNSEALSKIVQEATQAGSASGEQGLSTSFEPCWAELGGASLNPVTIEVTLDGRGRLARPPTIIRATGTKLNELRLRSEAAAISAIAACGGKTDPRFAGATYRLQLGKSAH